MIFITVFQGHSLKFCTEICISFTSPSFGSGMGQKTRMGVVCVSGMFLRVFVVRQDASVPHVGALLPWRTIQSVSKSDLSPCNLSSTHGKLPSYVCFHQTQTSRRPRLVPSLWANWVWVSPDETHIELVYNLSKCHKCFGISMEIGF